MTVRRQLVWRIRNRPAEASCGLNSTQPQPTTVPNRGSPRKSPIARSRNDYRDNQPGESVPGRPQQFVGYSDRATGSGRHTGAVSGTAATGTFAFVTQNAHITTNDHGDHGDHAQHRTKQDLAPVDGAAVPTLHRRRTCPFVPDAICTRTTTSSTAGAPSPSARSGKVHRVLQPNVRRV